MKKLLLISAALAVLATPALAATKQKHVRPSASAAAASAYASDRVRVRRPPMLDPYVVIENGQYLGRDPDPFIRLQLYRDPGFSSY